MKNIFLEPISRIGIREGLQSFVELVEPELNFAYPVWYVGTTYDWEKQLGKYHNVKLENKEDYIVMKIDDNEDAKIVLKEILRLGFSEAGFQNLKTVNQFMYGFRKKEKTIQEEPNPYKC